MAYRRGGTAEGVEVADVRTGAARFVPCEVVVFTGDGFPTTNWPGWPGWPWTRHPGPAVDGTLSTSLTGVFAAGNLVHAAETADIAALSGRHAARHIAALLAGEPAADGAGATRRPILVTPPLKWISPNTIGGSAAPPRSAVSCSAAPTSAAAPGWRSGRTAGCWPGRARPARPGTAGGSARAGWPGSTRRAALRVGTGA